MRDGIYRVDFQKGKDAGKGIARVRNGDFTGIDQTHTYIGRIKRKGEQLSGSVEKSNHPGMHSGATSQHATLNLNGKQNETGEFELYLESEGSGGRVKFTGEWVADL
jgi:hypothetical protein